jgi:hypothetical protein
MTRKQIPYFLLFILGGCLIILEIHIYRQTLIDLYIPLAIIFSTGIIASLIDHKRFFEWYGKNVKTVFYILCQNIVSWGFIICTLLMGLNFYFSENKVYNDLFPIVKWSSMPGSKGNRGERTPLVVVHYKGMEKELIFANKFLSSLNEYKYVELRVKRGCLGFDILHDKALVK